MNSLAEALARLLECPDRLERLEAAVAKLVEERADQPRAELLSPAQILERHPGIWSRPALYRAIRAGHIRASRVGRRLLIDARSLEPSSADEIARLAGVARGVGR